MTDAVRPILLKPEQTKSYPGKSSQLLDQPVILLFVVGSFLAVSMIFAKAAPQFGWHPLALLQWSIIGGAILLFLATRLADLWKNSSDTETSLKLTKPLLTYMAMSGLLFITPNMIAVVAAPKVGAGFVSLSFAFPLVLTYAFAVLIGLERLQILRAIGVLFGLAGAVSLALSGTKLSADASLWSMFALAIPVFLAVGNIYRTLHWPTGAKPVDLALGMMAAGFLVLTAFTSIAGIPVKPESWTTGALGLLVAQIMIFALQYGLYFRLQQTAGPVYLSQIGSVAAVIGLGLGFLIFGEVPNIAKLAAVVAVGLGIVFVTLGRSRD
ncbi:MAG: DMT family transporter [Roseibium sp.]